MQLNPIQTSILDGENNIIEVDYVYRVRGDQFLSTIKAVYQKHGDGVQLLPISAGSAGGGVFQQSKDADVDIVGIQFTATTEVHSMLSPCPDLTQLALDQILIDPESQHVYAGSAVTLEQLNQALQVHLGEHYKVLGADLTSYTYAQVGSTFMTGGMGPQRRYFSDSVEKIALYDGEKIKLIEGSALTGFAGTYGWTGIVTAVCCRYCQLPKNEIAFAMPVNNTPDALANLLAHFAKRSFLEIQNGKLQTDSGETDCILGIEHVTAKAMGPMLATGADTDIHRRARQLQEKCQLADADGLVFINGRSNQDVEAFLFSVVDDPESDTPTISGIALEHTEVFKVADEMRAVREAVPAAARGQALKGQFSFKGHTDANIRLDRKQTGEAMKFLWQANMRYVSAVNDCFDSNATVRGEILVYGHLNPYGVDPHNRITLASDSETDCKRVIREIAKHTHQFIRELDALCVTTGSRFIGGEKGAGSEFELMEAFENLEQIPDYMQQKFALQKEQITRTDNRFSWRALPSYR